jgi:Ni/Fe-hydrogenase subunit HybB-like protein
VWVWGVYLLLKAEDLIMAGQLAQAFTLDTQSIWFLSELVIGVILPIILYSQEKVRQSQRGLITAAILATVGTVFNRFNATLVGQVAVEGASYTPHWIELAIQFGVLAAAVLAWYLAAHLLPIFEEDRKLIEAAGESHID